MRKLDRSRPICDPIPSAGMVVDTATSDGRTYISTQSALEENEGETRRPGQDFPPAKLGRLAVAQNKLYVATESAGLPIYDGATGPRSSPTTPRVAS